VHFADALKKACHIIFGIPLEDMETEEGKQKLTHLTWPVKLVAEIPSDMPGLHPYNVSAYTTPETYLQHRPHSTLEERSMTVREVLQFIGTELFRNQLDPDVWLNSIFLKPWREDDVVIIADARFPNEAEIARENGLLIGIERDTGLVSDGHKSETALDDFVNYHYTIDNNGSFEELRGQLGAILYANDLIV